MSESPISPSGVNLNAFMSPSVSLHLEYEKKKVVRYVPINLDQRFENQGRRLSEIMYIVGDGNLATINAVLNTLNKRNKINLLAAKRGFESGNASDKFPCHVLWVLSFFQHDYDVGA